MDRTQRAIRPVAVALGAFSLLLALAIVLIVGPLLARAVRLQPRERGILRSLGVGTTEQLMVPTLAAALVGVPWVILAVVAVGIALVADLATLAPAAAAARTKTATVLRSE